MENEDKRKEKIYTSKYMYYKYDFFPQFIDSGIDIPDCYFIYNKDLYAVEVTRYFFQNSEKVHKSFVNDIQKCMKSGNFFENVYNRLGKQKSPEVTFSFENLKEMKQMIIDNKKYINYLEINDNCYINYDGKKKGDVFCKKSNKHQTTIKEFIKLVAEDLRNNEFINMEIKTKNKYEVSISFAYNKTPYYGKEHNKKVIPTFCWFNNDEELYTNIINAIIKKNIKLVREYIPKLKKYKVKYSYYNLVVFSDGIPAEVDENTLYERIIQIPFKYDEIAIFLWGELMVINHDGYEIIDTQK